MLQKLRTCIGEHKKTIYILMAFGFLSVILYVQGLTGEETEALYVERVAQGGQSENRTYTYQTEDGRSEEVEITVSPVQLTEEAVRELLEQAVTEWEQIYLGDNVSEDCVQQDLNLVATLCDGLVRVDYRSGDYGLLQTDGTIHNDELSEGGSLVELSAEFTCQEMTRTELRYVLLMPPEEGTAHWYNWKLKNLIRQEQEADLTAQGFTMPDNVEGHPITWVKEKERTWIYLLVLGVVSALCLELKGKEETRQWEKKRKEKLLYEYPQLVDQISMLICSGMTIRGAWKKILATDAGMEHRESRVFIEEMWITYREISSGGSERNAYEDFGQRIGLAPYKRFATLLAQNLTKGTRDLQILLEQESMEALELRKNQAIRRGEEAGTKLLLPMLLMFVLLLVVLLVPAAQQFIS